MTAAQLESVVALELTFGSTVQQIEAATGAPVGFLIHRLATSGFMATAVRLAGAASTLRGAQ
jgi:hypothetical protein